MDGLDLKFKDFKFLKFLKNLKGSDRVCTCLYRKKQHFFSFFFPLACGSAGAAGPILFFIFLCLQ
jgi:hypothetical protein